MNKMNTCQSLFFFVKVIYKDHCNIFVTLQMIVLHVQYVCAMHIWVDIIPKLPGHIIQAYISARSEPFSCVYVGPFCFPFRGEVCQSQRARLTLSRQPSQTLTSNPGLFLMLKKLKKNKQNKPKEKNVVSTSTDCWPLSFWTLVLFFNSKWVTDNNCESI